MSTQGRRLQHISKNTGRTSTETLLTNLRVGAVFRRVGRLRRARRDEEPKVRTSAEFGLNPYLSPSIVDNTLANSETDTSAGISILCVKAFENPEDLLVILRIDPDTVVLDREPPAALVL